MSATTFHIVTFGCQMNKLDAEILHGRLSESGLVYTEDPSDAGVLIYHTCSVRDQAENRVLSNIGRWRKKAERWPRFVLCVTGCMAQRLGEDLAKRFPFVRIVCGTRSFLKMPDYIQQTLKNGQQVIDTEDGRLDYRRDPSLRERASHHAYVSIMRGCSNYCTYCIVPMVRGHEISRDMDEIIEEVRRMAGSGVSEITLLGQNVNAYGQRAGDPETSRGGLARLLDELDGENIRRIRFVTSHPADMTEDILHAVARNKKVCEHLHMPIQSASDSVLKRMNRKYTQKHYLEVIEKARKIIPGAAFSSDFIVGFPGETEDDFQQTLSLLKKVKFQQSYIFRYSPRPDTRASGFVDDVPDETKRERQQRLLEAQRDVDLERREGLAGETLEVMCTGKNTSCPQEGGLIGRSRHNDIVVFGGEKYEAVRAGNVCNVIINKATALTLYGELSSIVPDDTIPHISSTKENILR